MLVCRGRGDFGYIYLVWMDGGYAVPKAWLCDSAFRHVNKDDLEVAWLYQSEDGRPA